MAARLRSAVGGGARGLAMGLAIVAVTTAATGLLYFLRQPTAHLPGLRVSDSLPLDELASHAAVPIIVFVIVYALGGLALALLGRALRFDGLAIALVVAAGVGLWLYLASAISIFIVRQVSLSSSFVAARDLSGVYLGAALCGAAVALLARPASREHRLTRLLPSAVGLLGVINLLAGSLPNPVQNLGVLHDLLVGPPAPLTRTLEVATGILLLISLGGLGRRSRRALWAAILLTVVSLGIRVIGAVVVSDFSVAATVACVLIVLIALAGRDDFTFRGDSYSHAVVVERLAVVIVGGLAYSLITLFINRTADGKNWKFAGAFHATAESLLASTPKGDAELSGDFGAWFPWSLRAVVALGLVWALASWFAPWRHRLAEGSAHRDRAERVVQRWGADSLAPFTLRGDKAYFFYPESAPGAAETTLIAYRVLRGVAIVSGDPVGPAERAGEAFGAFLQRCAERGWRVFVVGASERLGPMYRALGLHVCYHGDEAVLDPNDFSLAGGARKSVRQAVQRLERKGYTAQTSLAGALALSTRDELLGLEEEWLAGHPRKGFVMELDDLFRLDGDDAVFVVGRDDTGQLVGFLELAVCPASRSLSLSTMPRSPLAPNGLNAFLIVHALEWAAANGYLALSLNFAPAARLLGPDADPHGLARLARFGLLLAKRVLGLQLDDLLSFNQRFAPRWQSRYVVFQRHRQLPRVVTAAMAAERYLPFTDLLRGRDWARPGDTSSDAPSPARV